MGRPLAIALLVVALDARAWPVDWVHDLEVGKERFVRLPQVEWLEVEDPKVAGAEWLPASHELLLTGLKPGRTLLLLGSEGQVAVWRLRVGGPPVLDPGAGAAAEKACPGLKSTPAEQVKLFVPVRGEPCRRALRAWFETDAVEARSLELLFDPEMIQAQLKGLTQAIAGLTHAKVEARYVGACLVLEGTVTEAERRKVLWEVFRQTLGRPALDDRLEVAPTPPVGRSIDAGPPPEVVR